MQVLEIVTVIRRRVEQSQTGERVAPFESTLDPFTAIEPTSDLERNSDEINPAPEDAELNEPEQPFGSPAAFAAEDVPDFSAFDESSSQPDTPEPVATTANDETLASKMFDKAKDDIKNGEQPAAIKTLQALVSLHPNSAYAAKARAALRKNGIEPAG